MTLYWLIVEDIQHNTAEVTTSQSWLSMVLAVIAGGKSVWSRTRALQVTFNIHTAEYGRTLSGALTPTCLSKYAAV